MEIAAVASLASISQGLATYGRGAGARLGDWSLKVVESGHLVDDRVRLNDLREVEVERNPRTEQHLLRPYDLLVTARSQSVKAALVPAEVSRTVAGSTLLVIRTPDVGSGLSHYLWYYLTSERGRRVVEARLTATSLPTLSARALGEIPIAIPPAAELRRLAELIEASEVSYRAAVEAAEIRHHEIREAIVAAISSPPDRFEGTI